mmetsp:Transcript_1519/g.4119  ORF Transcript_1519/g.4119 Transcript_1519/m.4119 type:complete len:104 (-) Transcript_1519:365-676(-)
MMQDGKTRATPRHGVLKGPDDAESLKHVWLCRSLGDTFTPSQYQSLTQKDSKDSNRCWYHWFDFVNYSSTHLRLPSNSSLLTGPCAANSLTPVYCVVAGASGN